MDESQQEEQQNPNPNPNPSESAAINPRKINIGQAYSYAFDISKGFKRKYFLALLIVSIAYLPIFGLSLALQFLAGAFEPDPDLSITNTIFSFFSQIVPTFLSGPLIVGLSMIALKRVRAMQETEQSSETQQIDTGEVLNYFDKIIPLFITTIMMYLLIFLGFLLFILPGIYLFVAYIFSTLLVADKGLSPWQALETSRKAVTKQWFIIFLSIVGITLFFMISIIPLGIGLLWSMPWTALLFTHLYQKLFDDIAVKAQVSESIETT